MGKEIERKFLVISMPSLENLIPVKYERYFVFRNNEVEMRVQKKGEKYEFERKEKENNFSSNKIKFEITNEEFEMLKNISQESIKRDSYKISENPEITLKMYHGRFEGLKRVEVEFKSEEEAFNFKPLSWFGDEITDSPLGKDSRLLSLKDEEFKKLLK